MEKKVIQIGQMDNTKDHTFESANRVYFRGGQCPTIPTCTGGHTQPKTIKKVKVIGGIGDMWGDKQYRQQYRVLSRKDVSYAITSLIPILVIKEWK